MPLLHLKLALHLEPLDVGHTLATHYDCIPTHIFGDPPFVPSYNLKPGCVLPVLHCPVHPALSSASQAAAHVVLRTMRWGLLPNWSEYEGVGTPVVKTTAVVEGTKPMWVTLRRMQRCAVVCQGFFVWRGHGKASHPFYVLDKTAPVILLAGLYDTVKSPEGDKYTFTLLHHSDNTYSESLSPIVLHDSITLSAWLDTGSQLWNPGLDELITPATSIYKFLSSYQVLPRIERERSSSPSMIQPISRRTDGIAMAFTRQTARSAPTQTPAEHDEALPATQRSQHTGPSPQLAGSAPPRTPLRPLPPSQRAEPKRRGTRGSAKRGAPSRRGKRARSRSPPKATGPPAKRPRVQVAAQLRDPSVEIIERPPAVQTDRESSPDIVEIPPPARRSARANVQTTATAGPSRTVGASSARATGARAGERMPSESAAPSVIAVSAAPSPSPPPDVKGKGKESVRSRRGAA
ncbi:hypothetical protein PsYK624_119880 [Phanerochaete sordida]|uniref:DUF159-domain-containing protein n=1 Tax=Phanerochaete sordida TaxID=48140 RepID=A0A9P3LHY1_9APHY|nr:hypothetical protein PsYK624_119880 [Phanerochaete sordida]